MPKKYYLAGPMSGVPYFNVPLFDEVTERLRAGGMEIISPAELDSDEIRKVAMQSPTGQLDASQKIAGASWGDLLARDVRIVANEVDGIIFLPDWQKSRGAKLEAFVGLLCGKEFKSYNPVEGTMTDLAPGWVEMCIHSDMVRCLR